MVILVDHSGDKGLGDIVCESALYQALKSRHPEAELISRQGRTLLWGHPLIDGFDEGSPDDAFDRVIRPVSCLESAARLGESLLAGRNVFEHFLWLTGFAPQLEPPALYPLGRELADLGVENSGEGGLVVAFSADSKEPDRRWGEERFLELARYLEAAHGANLIEIGSGLCSGHLGIGLDMVGQTDLRQILAILALADLFVGNHGGLTHLAGAVGTPILAPWGASTPSWAYAYDAESIAVETLPECRHCAWTGNAHPECRRADPQIGRVACTQGISVADMRAAADRHLPYLLQERVLLQERKRARIRLARDPRTLSRFDATAGVSAFSHLHAFFGGGPGWGREHRNDNFARLRQLVAFPDWQERPADGLDLVVRYVAEHARDPDQVLFLTAQPWTGPQICQELTRILSGDLRAEMVPKIAVVLGAVSAKERQALVARAETYLRLDSPYDI